MDKYEKLEAQTQAWSREWWTTLMITGLWDFCHECWSFHNKEKHGHDKKEAEKKQSKTLVYPWSKIDTLTDQHYLQDTTLCMIYTWKHD